MNALHRTGNIAIDPLTPLSAADAAALFAASHADGGAGGWSEAAIEDALARNGFGRVARESTDRDAHLAGAALVLPAGPDAELANIAVAADSRRRGLGRMLTTAVADDAAKAGFERLLLEVAADNAPAQALYQAIGFVNIGRRKAYYRRSGGAVDAKVMALKLANRN